MPDEKKKFKNLSTYAVIMILAVIILIIIAAMADDREEQFENQIGCSIYSLLPGVVENSFR